MPKISSRRKYLISQMLLADLISDRLVSSDASMSGQPSPARQYIFGPFAYDEMSGELYKHGVRLRLEGQPLQILAALIRQPGQVVTRDEFQQRLWRGGTFVDFDHGLNAAMNRLRQVLGDSADQPRYIETLSGRGYRFIAPVQETFPKPVLVMASPPVAVEPIQQAMRSAWMSGLGKRRSGDIQVRTRCRRPRVRPCGGSKASGWSFSWGHTSGDDYR